MALLGAGITAAIFPAMARAYVRAGEEGLAERLEYGLRLSLAVALPAMAVLSGVATPLVQVLFERGAFEPADTVNVARVIPIVLLGAVVFQMVGNLMARSFYVTKDTHTVPIVAAGTSILYIFLARALVGVGGYVGLAAADPIYRGLSIAVLVALLATRLRPFRTSSLSRITVMYGGASFVAFLGARLISNALGSQSPLLPLLAGLVVGALVYMVIILWLDREIAIAILEMTGVEKLLRGAKAGFGRIEGAIQG
jgi:putative peptidoglycan lipid II flippase